VFQFSSFYDFSTGFWNCCNSVVFCVFLFINDFRYTMGDLGVRLYFNSANNESVKSRSAQHN
jgi:hypothetical protein